jgi:hypothetical protein
MIHIIGFLVLAGYLLGIWKFWSGYRLTNYNPSFTSRLSLALLWPLLIANATYRRNFVKALKG